MSLSKTSNSQFQILRTPVNDELGRLASYVNWPTSAQVRPSALSRQGFVYEGQGVRTRCVACGIVVESWKRGDRIQDVHRSKSPLCPFVVSSSSTTSSNGDVDGSVRTQLQQLRVSDHQAFIRSDGAQILTLTTLPASSTEPTVSTSVPSVPHPGRPASSTVSVVNHSSLDFIQLQSESVRLSTFHNWPSRIVEPRELTAVGFFYMGQADRVQCAFCRGCLHNWRQGDRPADEHRRYFPDCPLMCGTATGNIPCDSVSSVSLNY